jgi:hypothetical protein
MTPLKLLVPSLFPEGADRFKTVSTRNILLDGLPTDEQGAP